MHLPRLGGRGTFAVRCGRTGVVHDGRQRRNRGGAGTGDPRTEVLQPHPLRRRRGGGDRAAGRDGGGDRRRGRRRRLPGVQRTVGHAVRAGVLGRGGGGELVRRRQRRPPTPGERGPRGGGGP